MLVLWGKHRFPGMKARGIWFIAGLVGFAGVSLVFGEPFRIEVVDAVSGWPVPLVELETTHSVRFVSDNAGIIAFDLPELMGSETWLSVKGHGYEVEADGFGYRGIRVTPVAGGSAVVKVKRTLPAKRIGRLTGGGLFAESRKLGQELDWTESGVLGCDSVQTALHRGKVYWAWGDTILAHYPLGLFQMLGATTPLRPFPSFEPPLKPAFDYFRGEGGRVRNIAEMPGAGPTWVSGYASVKDRAGEYRLVGNYVKIKPPLTAYESGLCVWNDEVGKFDLLKVIWNQDRDGGQCPNTPDGHATSWMDGEGHDWLLFGDPFPDLKCEATFEAWSDPAKWITLEPQESVPRRGDGDPVKVHRGSIAWNEFRQQWVSVFTQMNGKSSVIGEIWYAEAEVPIGPWNLAVQVVTHDNYTFYNPKIHEEFTDSDSPILLFEGTYTKTFAKHPPATPRYDYNQILYRLDLDEMALAGPGDKR